MVQLIEFVGSIINSFLGPNKSNKFLIQDKDVCVVRCPLYIFQNTHLQDPLSSLIEETLFAHHDLYGCSTLSLLSMWYFWNEEFRLVLEEGCEIQDIIKHSQNGLELAISALSDISISTDKMFFKKRSHERIVHKIPMKQNVSNQAPISICYSSRYFSPSQNTLTYREYDESDLKTIIECLDHDEDPEICDLTLDCWKRQMLSSNSFKFKTDGLLICPIILPCSSSRVVDGLVIKSNLNNSWYQDADINRVLIIKGSITYEYSHLGFSPKVSVNMNSLTNQKEVWRKKTCEFIKQLNPNVILLKDDIDPEISSFCVTHSVLILMHIPLKTFKILCNAFQYSPCTYIWDCQEEDVIKNISITKWKPNDITLKDQYFLLIVHLENILQTIVLCHPNQAILEKMKHQMHHFLSRLSLSFESNRLLPGGGEMEKLCTELLRKQPYFHDPSDPAKMRIMEALVNGFQNYSAVVSRKKSLHVHKFSGVLDEMSSKLNALRSALSLVLLTLQCDTAVVNGLVNERSMDFTNLCINTL